MKSKRYNNSFTSSSMVKEEGRTAYYKLLDSVETRYASNGAYMPQPSSWRTR